MDQGTTLAAAASPAQAIISSLLGLEDSELVAHADFIMSLINDQSALSQAPQSGHAFSTVGNRILSNWLKRVITLLKSPSARVRLQGLVFLGQIIRSADYVMIKSVSDVCVRILFDVFETSLETDMPTGHTLNPSTPLPPVAISALQVIFQVAIRASIFPEMARELNFFSKLMQTVLECVLQMLPQPRGGVSNPSKKASQGGSKLPVLNLSDYDALLATSISQPVYTCVFALMSMLHDAIARKPHANAIRPYVNAVETTSWRLALSTLVKPELPVHSFDTLGAGGNALSSATTHVLSLKTLGVRILALLPHIYTPKLLQHRESLASPNNETGTVTVLKAIGTGPHDKNDQQHKANQMSADSSTHTVEEVDDSHVPQKLVLFGANAKHGAAARVTEAAYAWSICVRRTISSIFVEMQRHFPLAALDAVAGEIRTLTSALREEPFLLPQHSAVMKLQSNENASFSSTLELGDSVRARLSSLSSLLASFLVSFPGTSPFHVFDPSNALNAQVLKLHQIEVSGKSSSEVFDLNESASKMISDVGASLNVGGERLQKDSAIIAASHMNIVEIPSKQVHLSVPLFELLSLIQFILALEPQTLSQSFAALEGSELDGQRLSSLAYLSILGPLQVSALKLLKLTILTTRRAVLPYSRRIATWLWMILQKTTPTPHNAGLLVAANPAAAGAVGVPPHPSLASTGIYRENLRIAALSTASALISVSGAPSLTDFIHRVVPSLLSDLSALTAKLLMLMRGMRFLSGYNRDDAAATKSSSLETPDSATSTGGMSAGISEDLDDEDFHMLNAIPGASRRARKLARKKQRQAEIDSGIKKLLTSDVSGEAAARVGLRLGAHLGARTIDEIRAKEEQDQKKATGSKAASEGDNDEAKSETETENKGADNEASKGTLLDRALRALAQSPRSPLMIYGSEHEVAISERVALHSAETLCVILESAGLASVLTRSARAAVDRTLVTILLAATDSLGQQLLTLPGCIVSLLYRALASSMVTGCGAGAGSGLAYMASPVIPYALTILTHGSRSPDAAIAHRCRQGLASARSILNPLRPLPCLSSGVVAALSRATETAQGAMVNSATTGGASGRVSQVGGFGASFGGAAGLVGQSAGGTSAQESSLGLFLFHYQRLFSYSDELVDVTAAFESARPPVHLSSTLAPPPAVPASTKDVSTVTAVHVEPLNQRPTEEAPREPKTNLFGKRPASVLSRDEEEEQEPKQVEGVEGRSIDDAAMTSEVVEQKEIVDAGENEAEMAPNDLVNHGDRNEQSQSPILEMRKEHSTDAEIIDESLDIQLVDGDDVEDLDETGGALWQL